MRPRTRWSPQLLVLVLVSGCITDPDTEALNGSWRTAPEDLSPSGWYQSTLSLNVYRAFELDIRTYGLYAGQSRNELTAYERIEGTYRVEGERLIFTPARSVWWDSFYGPNSREQVQEPFQAAVFDSARYSILGDRLILEYLSYPFDAPVPTTRVFTRQD